MKTWTRHWRVFRGQWWESEYLMERAVDCGSFLGEDEGVREGVGVGRE